MYRRTLPSPSTLFLGEGASVDWLWGCVPYVVSIKCSLRNKFGCNTTSMRSSVSSPDETLRTTRRDVFLTNFKVFHLVTKHRFSCLIYYLTNIPYIVGFDQVTTTPVPTPNRSPPTKTKTQTNKQQQPQNCHGPFARLFSCGF